MKKNILKTIVDDEGILHTGKFIGYEEKNLEPEEMPYITDGYEHSNIHLFIRRRVIIEVDGVRYSGIEKTKWVNKIKGFFTS